MTDPIRDKLLDAQCRHALRVAGANEELGLPLLRAYMRVDDDGTVQADDGRTPAQVVEALRKDSRYGPLFGESASDEGERPSWEGKKYRDMTLDEKVEYTAATYPLDR